MLQKLMIPALLLYVFFASSCGTAKKLQAANGQISTLTEQNTQLTATVNSQKSQISDLTKQTNDLSAQNKSLSTQFASYKKTCEANAEELKSMQALLDEFEQNVQGLVEKIDVALTKFDEKGIDVYAKDHIIYVDMNDDLMYKSGSTQISAAGKEALCNLASVLNEFPKLNVVVVGNTDDRKFKNGSDNLTLSTERANGVVRLFVNKYKVDPTRLLSAGKGKYNPIADNATAEGRAKNRRTEIILNPDWQRLWQIVKSENASVKN